MRPHVWIPEQAPATQRARIAEIAEVHVFPASGPIADGASGADLLVAAHGNARALEVARQLPGLKVIQSFSAGVDAIVDQVPDGVVLCDAAGVHDVAVAEWVVMAILASNRRLPAHVDSQRQGTWGREPRTGTDLVDANVLILGAGAIGRAVERRLIGFDCTFTRVARRPRAGVYGLADLPTLLPTADVVVNLLPLTPATRGLAGRDFFAAMRPGSLFVNASRGAIVDTDALTEAVLGGRIRCALDVTDPEPLPDGDPLWAAPGALITPHAASDVAAEEARAWQLIFDQVARLANGEPLINVVADGY